jgi:hypothetical protein
VACGLYACRSFLIRYYDQSLSIVSLKTPRNLVPAEGKWESFQIRLLGKLKESNALGKDWQHLLKVVDSKFRTLVAR